MKATITGRNRDREFWVFKMFGEGFALGVVGFEPIAQGDGQPLDDGRDRRKHISEPFPHESCPLIEDAWGD